VAPEGERGRFSLFNDTVQDGVGIREERGGKKKKGR